MGARVFSQLDDLVSALPQLLKQSRRFFAADAEVLGASPPHRADRESARVTLRFGSPRRATSAVFTLEARPRTAQDLFDAEAAEARCHAAGMALLAGRCTSVWSVQAVEHDSVLELELCGALASVALGPILPDDGSGLYGVRGAMERAERHLGSTSP